MRSRSSPAPWLAPATITVSTALRLEAIPSWPPASFRRGQLTVAVGTGGASPRLAASLRDRLASNLGEEFAILLPGVTLAEATATAERVRENLMDSADPNLPKGVTVYVRGGKAYRGECPVGLCPVKYREKKESGRKKSAEKVD